MRALVIGGTGPTGHFIVNGLIARGFEVSILHTGNHEVAEIPASVVHIHTNPFDEQALIDALGNSHFDVTLAMYGRLRRVAEIMVGRTERFISVGGGPAYRGFMNADMVHPRGCPSPLGRTRSRRRAKRKTAKATGCIARKKWFSDTTLTPRTFGTPKSMAPIKSFRANGPLSAASWTSGLSSSSRTTAYR